MKLWGVPGRLRVVAVLCALAAWGLVPVAATASAGAAAPSPGTRTPSGSQGKSAKLSPRLSALAAAASATTGSVRAAALGLPTRGAGSLIRRAGGQVLVAIRTDGVGTPTVAELRAAGAHVVNVSSQYRTVTADVAPGALAAIAANPAVRYVSEVLAPRVASRGSFRVPVAPTGVATASDLCGSVDSEADTTMNVATARAAHSVDGTGQTIGILSDSYNTAVGSATNAQTDVSTGDLPGVGNPCGHTTPVVVQADFSGGGQADEGRGMAQLVHDLAPGAKIAFATAFNGELDFASQITKLRTVNHATVIADDVSYLDEPFFQNGPISNAANLATSSGVPYFSAAGNDNVIVGAKNVASYAANSFRGTPCPAPVVAVEAALLACHNFNPSGAADNTDAITVAPGGGFGVDLQWAQPWGGVTTDYDVFLVDSSGTVIAQSTINNLSSETPFEFASYANQTSFNQTIRVVIGKYSGAANARLKFVLAGAQGILSVEHNVSVGGDIVGPTIFGHSGAALVGSTAAIPYNSANAPESYSSRGPVTLYFNNTPSLTPLAAPKVLAKPDFAATDGVQTTFFAQQISGVWRFYGTSAAAPQAAAVAALLQQDDPALTAAQVMTRLHDTARAVPTNGAPSDVGGGYIDADAALAGLSETPGAPHNVSATTGDSQASVSWTAPATNPSFPITGYTVTPYIGAVAQSPVDFDASATTQAVGPLVNGTTYTFKVVATNANGPGTASAPSAPIVVGVPTGPSVVGLAAGNASATVRWNPPASDNGSPVTGYVVTPYVAGVARPAQAFATAATTRVIVSLTNGVAYTFRVAAKNANGKGLLGSPSTPILVGAPTPPTTPTAKPGNAAATVAWHAPASNGGSAVVHYFVTPYRNGVAQAMHTFAATPLTQTITGLTNGAPYLFRIAAANAHGTGVSVATASIIVGTPAAPSAAHATAGIAQASVHWTAPMTGNGAAITGYVITPYVGAVAEPPQTFASAATTETVTGLTATTTYTFTVAATNARGQGTASAKSNAVTT